MPNVVVVGAGVSGLTTAYLLSKNPDYHVTVVAKHAPGDYDIEYTSPWAGANFIPMTDYTNNTYEKNTWPELYRLATDVPEAGIHTQNMINYSRTKDANSATGQWFNTLNSPSPWFKDVLPDFRVIPTSELPKGKEITSGIAFTSVCINTAVYLPYLLGHCVKNGATVHRAAIAHISEATSLHHSGQPADLVVNCTGLLAAKLGGVMDATVFPIRGQIAVVRNDPGVMMSISGTDDAPDELCYIMKRAAGGGTVIGGTYQKGRWESQPDPDTAVRIMKRAVELCPALTGGKGIEALSVVRHVVGLRPYRDGGVRLEKEKIDGTWVVHNYGHGGWGYQGSYGCSERAVELADECLRTKAKL